MLRRPILQNRPLKPKKPRAYRPGRRPEALLDDIAFAQPTGLKRTARLAEKLEQGRCGR
jgi:hypothetical protein